ncbi:S-protein homolog 5-like [Macadamia integrifolia]|uniref:S-protein homolog 5-like n=1 Tax=Macadamia integrifolia TaxID=60698 RepID=UPI001C501D29|nr:S-protein homolog 5-like [Macadamia integrifolia]
MWVGEFSSITTADAKRHVRMINELGEGYVLTIRCKSKDDDLGVHYIPYKQYFEWGFNDNFWETTLFFCRIQWRDADISFDVYDAKRDRFRCDQCWWSARIDALYFVDYKTGASDAWLDWHGFV